jgi:uncharacterized protein (DUF2336 family)
MTDLSLLLSDLESAIARAPLERRTKTLQQVTRLFLLQADQLNEPQVELFGEVLGRLTEEIERCALAELSLALAPLGNAPLAIIQRLAHASDIAVAGPVLTHSPRLGEDDLVVIARTGKQGHLLAISRRPAIEGPVTDLLVRRGDREVVRTLAGNPAARLSESGYVALVRRAGQDELLAEHVSRRNDLSPALFHRLVLQATAVVQSRLLATAAPDRKAEIDRVLAKVAAEVRQPARADYAQARQAVEALRRAGRLDEAALAEFAKAGEFERSAAALAALCRIPVEVADRLIGAGKPDPILILCKAMGYRWPTTAALLSLRVGDGGSAMDHALRQFERLSPALVQRILYFWRARPALEVTSA